jgi:hypothetical protein
LRAVDDDALVLGNAVHDLDEPRPALAGMYFAALDDVVVHDEHIRVAALGHESFLRHQQRRRDFALQGDGHEHALPQQAIAVRNFSADGHRARDGVDSGIHVRDDAFE